MFSCPKNPPIQNKKDLILEAAQALFMANGFSAVSMDDIAREAGVSKRTVYAYFKTKEDLFNHFLEKHCQCLHISFEQQLYQKGSLRNALFGFAKVFLTELLTLERIDFYRLVLAETRPSPQVGAKFMEAGPNQCARSLAQFFIDYSLQENKPLPASPEALANCFIGATITKIHMRVSLMNMPAPTEAEIEEIARLATDIFATYLEAPHSQSASAIEKTS